MIKPRNISAHEPPLRLVLMEAQLDAARSQALHYEAKLTITADYEQIKNKVISMETERHQLLVCDTM